MAVDVFVGLIGIYGCGWLKFVRTPIKVGEGWFPKCEEIWPGGFERECTICWLFIKFGFISLFLEICEMKAWFGWLLGWITIPLLRDGYKLLPYVLFKLRPFSNNSGYCLPLNWTLVGL